MKKDIKEFIRVSGWIIAGVAIWKEPPNNKKELR